MADRTYEMSGLMAADVIVTSREMEALCRAVNAFDDLVDALRPFADAAEAIDSNSKMQAADDWGLWAQTSNVREPTQITVGNCRRARLVLRNALTEQEPL
jgi:hypothetical protein